MVETWQIVAAGIPVFITASTVLGKVVWDNRSDVNRLLQRLLGHPGDDTDTGFIHETEDRLDCMEEAIETHAEVTHSQLRNIDHKVDTLVDVVVTEHDGADPSDFEREEREDFFRGGSSTSGDDD